MQLTRHVQIGASQLIPGVGPTMGCAMWAVLLSASLAMANTSGGQSEFARFAGEAPLVGTPAQPRLVTPETRRFRTLLRESAAAGPNFNGHYRVVHWGCGTGCMGWAIVNLASGAVWMAPEQAWSCWAPDESAEAEATEPTDWFDIRRDSSLLYLHECSHPRSDRRFDVRKVYTWSEGRLRLQRVDRLKE